jgi:hypothetical protein
MEGNGLMNIIPAKALLSLIESWKQQESEYKREGLVSECGALMMHRVELEELLKDHNVSLPTVMDGKAIEQCDNELLGAIEVVE